MRFINLLLQIFILMVVGTPFVYAQLIPDFAMTFKVVDPLGEDSVTIGLSTNASAGYDAGYDVIDTSALQLPVDLRIYDDMAADQLGDNCKHFSTSYLNFPSQNIYQIKEFEQEFTLVLRIDLEQINNWAEGSFCDDERVLAGTYLYFDLSSMFEYKFRNNIGLDFDLIEINPSGNVNLEAIDGYYWLVNPSPNSFCLTILAYNSPAIAECNIDIFFNVKLRVKNRLFVGIEETTKTPQIILQNNLVIVENAYPFKNYRLFDINSRLLKQQAITNNKTIITKSDFNQKILILQLTDPENSNFLIRKILNL